VNCPETRDLIHGYIDGELDLVHSLAVEQHLQGCAECTEVYARQQALHAAIKSGSLYYAVPSHLQKRIQSSIRQAARAEAMPRRPPWRALSLVAALAALLALAVGLLYLWPHTPASGLLAQEVVSSHIRSLMAEHLSDVASSDKHTVKPWFDGKLDFSPPVEDLAAQGFPLIGGRLDYLDNRPVAALVYGRNKHFINLFVWPAAQGDSGDLPPSEIQGYNLLHWTQGGMTFWAVSDLNTQEFQEFVRLIQTQAVPPGP